MVKIFLKPSLHKATSQSAKAYVESTLFPILPVSKLLPEIEKNHYLNKIQELVGLPDDHFKAVYEDLIDNFTRFVQLLPETYGEELGGLLNDGLRRGFLAIQILLETQQSRPHPLFVFAVFSIALLADVGQILNYRIMISDDKGQFIDDWFPYLGFMTEYGEYYKLRPYENTPQSLIRGATPLLARQLLSETAITWLSSNNQILDMWLAFLNKGEDWLGGFLKILKIDPRQFDARMGDIGFVPVDIKLYDPMGTDLGEKFLAWLKEGLKEGTIGYNEADSKVHVVKTSEYDISIFLQAPELFQQFTNVYLKSRDWIVVCKQFNHLGLTKLSGNDLKFEQFFSEAPDARANKMGFLAREKGGDKKVAFSEQAISRAAHLKEGVVIKDAKMIFGSKVPAVSQYVREIEMRWGTSNVLPKVKAKEGAPATEARPENGLKV